MSTTNASFHPFTHLPAASPISWAPNILLHAVISASTVALFSFLLLRPRSHDKAYDLGGLPFLIAWAFFSRRFDFIQDGFKKSGGKTFSFKVLQHRVVSIAGENARKVFFNVPGLSLPEGYRILMGGAPKLKDLNMKITSNGVDAQAEVDGDFVKRVLSLIRKDRIANTLPALLGDLQNRINAWGAESTIDPFKSVYDLVFQMTIRLATCHELAEDPAAVDQIARTYWTLEQSATPVSLLMPWFPGPAKRNRKWATTALYKLFLKFVERRRSAADATAPSTDPIDVLITDGYSDHAIIGTIMGILFAGVVNTGMNACWALLHLCSTSNTSWKKRVIDEYEALVEKHSHTFTDVAQSSSSQGQVQSQPLHKRLSSIPMHAWEDELPTMDLVIRETLRLSSLGSVIRRNRAQDVVVDGAVVRPGEFMTYQLADAHLNPEIYPDPMKFDPGRYEEGREEDRKEAFAFLGWGAGRHACAGMRLAKLELKLAVALVLLGFECELVDGSGKYPNALPVTDRNDIQKVRPLGERCYLKVKRIVE